MLKSINSLFLIKSDHILCVFSVLKVQTRRRSVFSGKTVPPKILQPNFSQFLLAHHSPISQTRQFHKSLSLKQPNVPSRLSSLQIKKRKRKILDDETIREMKPGYFCMTALATAEEYDLERLRDALIQQDLYVPTFVDGDLNETSAQPEVLHATAKYEVGSEPREMFFFREGSVVTWNMPELECSSLLSLLRKFEEQSYPEKVVHAECEMLAYCYAEGKKSGFSEGDVVFAAGGDTLMDKFTVSNALALSVKLGAWEASLERYIDSIEYVTEDLKLGRRIRMTQAEVLRKTGELFALRHLINLRSDLLDTPDFYWDREHLEPLYRRTCDLFSISRRTKVMNERLSHCLELVELLAAQLSDRHHVRLEWMIIILIMVEVGFEVLHYCDRFILHTSEVAT